MARVAINTGSIANDGTGDTLRAAGGIINSNFSDIYNYFGDGTNLNFSGGNWEVTAVGINTLSSVGIGTTNPRFALEVGAVGASGTSLWVNGNARVTGILTVGTASITLDGSSNTISVGSGVTINGSTGIIDATSIVVGGTTLTGAAVTRIEAGSGISVDQNTGQVTITATGGGGESYWSQNATGINTTSNIGIGTTTASSALTVQGNTSLETLNVSGVSTFSGAIDANSTANFQGDVTLQSNLILGDDDEIRLGNDNDLYIRNRTFGAFNHAEITHTGDSLTIQSNNFIVDAVGGANMLDATSGGSVNIYYSGSKKFETTNTGVQVTGTVTASNSISIGTTAYFNKGNDKGIFFGVPPFDSGLDALIFVSDTVYANSLCFSNIDYGARFFVDEISLNRGSSQFVGLGTEKSHFGGSSEPNYMVGIGTNDPSYTLDVAGYARIRDGLIVEGGSTYPVEISADVFVYGYNLDVSGVVTATTYYGDASRVVSGKWTLGANGTSNYTFDGVGVNAGNNYNTPMYLARGCVYEFVNNSGGSHPFQIRVSNGGAAYSTGVTNNGASSGTIRFEVPMDAPNSLYYQCTAHSGMGGTITVYPDAVV